MFFSAILRSLMPSNGRPQLNDSVCFEKANRQPKVWRIMGGCLSFFTPETRTDGEAQRLLGDATDQYQTLPPNTQPPILNEEMGKIKTVLEGMIRNGDPTTNAIILPADVRALWAKPYMLDFCREQSWYDKRWDKEDILKDYFVILSILIMSDPRSWDGFRTIFVDHNDRKDANLPFKKDQLRDATFMGENWRSFYAMQWSFCPLEIVEDSAPKKLNDDEKERRFPYMEPGKEIGAGAAGCVYKQVIAPGYVKYRSLGRESTNEKAKKVACKRVEHKQLEDVEFENLGTLRGFLGGHSRIMINISTIIRTEQNAGIVHYIFYDLAAYSLKTFLSLPEGTEGKDKAEWHENDYKRRNDSADKRRNGSHDWNSGDLIKESQVLADALDFLHRTLYKDTHYTLAHNDLKPDNILVFFPDSKNKEERYPVGQWKIADFGLAKIKTRTMASISDTPASKNSLYPGGPSQGETLSVDHTHRRRLSMSNDLTKSKRDPGRYTAPEIQGRGENQPDARQADIWSFGCVLAEVLAFAVKPCLVDELRNQCEPHDRGDQRFYDLETKELKDSVRTWLEGLKSQAECHTFGTSWIGECATLVCGRILVKDHNVRAQAGEIRLRLSEIHQGMKEKQIANTQAESQENQGPGSPFSDRPKTVGSPQQTQLPEISVSLPQLDSF